MRFMSRRLLVSARGAALVEYGILVGLIAVLAIAAVLALGQRIQGVFGSVSTALEQRVVAAAGGSGSGSGSGSGIPPLPFVDPNCLDPDNVGTVGNPAWVGCQNMLIVNNAYIAANFPWNNGWSFTVGGDVYTFNNSANNVYTGQVTNMTELFQNLNIPMDVGYLDVRNVTNMTAMFRAAAPGTFVNNISSWRTDNLVIADSMFENANGLGIVTLSGWQTHNLESTIDMFRNSQQTIPELTAWNTSALRFVSGMFSNMTLAIPYEADFRNWSYVSMVDMTFMFANPNGGSTINPDLTGVCVPSTTNINDIGQNNPTWDVARRPLVSGAGC